MKKIPRIVIAFLLTLSIYTVYQQWHGELPLCLQKPLGPSKSKCDPHFVHDTLGSNPFFGQAEIWARPGLPLEDAVAFLKAAGYRCKLPEDEAGRQPVGVGETSFSCVNETGEGLLRETTRLELAGRYEITPDSYVVRLDPALMSIEGGTEPSPMVPEWMRQLLERLQLVPPEKHRIVGWQANGAEHLVSALLLDVAGRLPKKAVTREEAALLGSDEDDEAAEADKRLTQGLQPVGQTSLPEAPVCLFVDAMVKFGMQAEKPRLRPVNSALKSIFAEKLPPWYWYERAQWQIRPTNNSKESPFTTSAAWVGQDLGGQRWRAELVVGASGVVESLIASVGQDTKRFDMTSPVSGGWVGCGGGRPVVATFNDDGQPLDAPQIRWAKWKGDTGSLFAANRSLWHSISHSEAERLLGDSLSIPLEGVRQPWPTGKAKLWQLQAGANEVVALDILTPPYYFDRAALERLHAKTHPDNRVLLMALAAAPCGLGKTLYPQHYQGFPIIGVAPLVSPLATPSCWAKLRNEAPSIASDLSEWWAAVQKDDQEVFIKASKDLEGLHGNGAMSKNFDFIDTRLTDEKDARLLAWMQRMLGE